MSKNTKTETVKKEKTNNLAEKLKALEALTDQMQDIASDVNYLLRKHNSDGEHHELYRCEKCNVVVVSLDDDDPAVKFGSKCPRCIIDLMNSAADGALWHMLDGNFMRGLHILMGMIVCDWTDLEEDGGSFMRGKAMGLKHQFLAGEPFRLAFVEAVHRLSEKQREDADLEEERVHLEMQKQVSAKRSSQAKKS